MVKLKENGSNNQKRNMSVAVSIRCFRYLFGILGWW